METKLAGGPIRLAASRESIAISRLDQIAQILNVDRSFFDHRPGHDGWASEPDLAQMNRFLESGEGRKLIESFLQVEDRNLRFRLVELIVSISAFRPVAMS